MPLSSWSRVLAILVVVAVASSIAFYSLTRQGGKAELIIYTYESLLKWGPNPNATWSKVFGGFEEKYGAKVRVVTFDDARTAMLAVAHEIKEGKRTADIIIGLDNILVEEAKEKGLLERYTPRNIDEIPGWLIDSLDPEMYAVPYDYSLIAFVYHKDKVPEEIMENVSFESFRDPELASKLVVEDPTRSSTGLSFLLWEITYYEKILKSDWTQWWRDVRSNIRVEPSWGAAYDVFFDEAAGRPIVASYGTDPAYSYYFYNDTGLGAALAKKDGKKYAWLQVEGIAIVKGTKHRDLAEKFVDWFLSREVQSEIPLNNWMYPANMNTGLPECYKYAIDPQASDIVILNTLISKQEIRNNLQEWLTEWTEIMQAG